MTRLGAQWIDDAAATLPVQAGLVRGLARIVRQTPELRSLTLSCSLGRGNADEFSDVDAGITHTMNEPLRLEKVAAAFATQLGDLVDLRVHDHPGFGDPTRRVARDLCRRRPA